MANVTTPEPSRGKWWYWGAWIFALGLLGYAIYLGWCVFRGSPTSQTAAVQAAVQPTLVQPTKEEIEAVSLPDWQTPTSWPVLTRSSVLHTDITDTLSTSVVTYTVESGDSIFGIAQAFNLKPETILWANYDLLNDNPDMISIGMQLKIPPANGVLYTWQDGDTLEGVAQAFDAKVEDIVSWSGNKIDLTDPVIAPGTELMVPNGHREFRQWLVPTIPRGRAGVSVNLLGAGACPGGYDGAYGTGGFVWPAANHYLSGNDYWSGHLGIDIAAGLGASVYAADSGVVVFAGPAFGGYGNMIMIDHGNGYQTLYAHLSAVYVGCGSSVLQGQVIGSAGSTGNSTGPHLHFEVRYLGGFVNPWFVLPAP
jgi:murein DD-endopeptidase MepM/ murein hydrolase activator NlpD